MYILCNVHFNVQCQFYIIDYVTVVCLHTLTAMTSTRASCWWYTEMLGDSFYQWICTPSVGWVSEYILNSTSAQLGYTVPFTLVDAGIQDRRQIKNTDNTKTEHSPEKANNANTAKQNNRGWFSRLLRHSARKRWAYSTTPSSQHGALLSVHEVLVYKQVTLSDVK